MSFKHNKKTNTGLLYEFCVRTVGLAVLEQNDGMLNDTKNLITSHFKLGSELNRELSLINELMFTSLLTKEAAVGLLQEVKTEARKQLNTEKLNQEKTNISTVIANSKCFEESFDFIMKGLKNYDRFVTAQTLLNCWTNKARNNLGNQAALEEVMVDMLMAKKEEPSEELDNKGNSGIEPEGVDGLVVKLFETKVNNKFASGLSTKEKEVIGLFVLDPECEKLTALLRELKQTAQLLLQQTKTEFHSDETVLTKVVEVGTLLESINPLKSSEDDVTFLLGFSALETELKEAA